MNARRFILLELIILLIISIPLVLSLFQGTYFSMHDDQHIARLYLLDQGIRQGDFFPRWVDTLGFSFGYPLFNFYPPLIYYIAEVFHLFGFSLIWSIKLMLVLGFLLSVLGMHWFLRGRVGAVFALSGAALYGYFSYHAIQVYVRGAFAEFFAMALLPFIFLSLENLANYKNIRSLLYFSILFALLILTHPLVAFPFVIFFGFYGLFFFFKDEHRVKLLIYFAAAAILGLALSSFFWLPAMLERNLTQIDKLSTTDLATYSLHYVCPQQFIYSAWGFGGSIPGCEDGLSFQIGKIYLGLFILSIFSAIYYWYQKKKFDKYLQLFIFYFLATLFSLLMTVSLSSIIWDNLNFLSYLQFPWRFLSFASFFLVAASILGIYFANTWFKRGESKSLDIVVSFIIILLTIGIYQKYFKPQNYIQTTDQKETTFEKIAWDVSLTSLDFIPKGAPTRQLNINRRTVDINKSDLHQDIFNVHSGTAKRVDILKNTYSEKEFNLEAFVPLEFWIYTFRFLGWTAYLNDQKIPILSNGTFNLIRIDIPQGFHNLKVVFENTTIRKAGNLTSGVAVVAIIYLFASDQFKEIKRRFTTRFNKTTYKLDR